jgi:type VI secretion system protein ImpM
MGAAFGAYGKIPGLGDFVRFGVDRGFHTAWDAWLQARIGWLRDNLAARWDDCYLSAPIWRFTLPGGVAGDAPVLGVLMASVDRVGRQFPLTLCARLDTDADLPLTHAGAEPTFAALEDVALAALEDGVTSADLAEMLETVPPATCLPAPHCAELGETMALSTTAAPHVGLAALCATSGGFGLWSCVLNGETRILRVTGLPDNETASAIFDQNADVWAAREGKENHR